MLWLAVACTIVLAAATTFQAAHSCGFSTGDESGIVEFHSSSSGSPLCLTCLMAQSLAAGLIFVVFSPVWRRRAVPQLRPAQLVSFLDSFRLFVRPPPVR